MQSTQGEVGEDELNKWRKEEIIGQEYEMQVVEK